MIIGDNMKKGFTLVEMIAVILIMALISLTVLPSILNQVSNKKEEISKASEQVIFTALSNYLNNKTVTYPKIAENTYCITLNELVQNGELTAPIKDLKSGNEIALNTVIKATLNIYADYDYCFVNDNNEDCNSCVEIRN